MDLRFTEDETRVPRRGARLRPRQSAARDPRKIVEGRHPTKEDYRRAGRRILASKGWAVPHWPVEWGGTGWSPVKLSIFSDEIQRANAPEPLPFGASMVGPVICTFGIEAQKRRFLPRIVDLERLVVPGLLRAGRRLRPRRPADDARGATATTRSSTARRPGPRWPNTPTGSSCLARTDPAGEEAGGHFLLARRHEDAGHHGAADPDDRRRPRGQRSLLRRRAGAGSRTSSARRTRAGTTPSSCSPTSAPASPASASRRRGWTASANSRRSRPTAPAEASTIPSSAPSSPRSRSS